MPTFFVHLPVDNRCYAYGNEAECRTESLRADCQQWRQTIFTGRMSQQCALSLLATHKIRQLLCWRVHEEITERAGSISATALSADKLRTEQQAALSLVRAVVLTYESLPYFCVFGRRTIRVTCAADRIIYIIRVH